MVDEFVRNRGIWEFLSKKDFYITILEFKVFLLFLDIEVGY